MKWHSKYLILFDFKINPNGGLVVTLKNVTAISGDGEERRE